ncbi:MAG TPA: cbb3-type cytochrome c oxidase N-terminal domain-containing protein [Catalimonadaceae bacterium]|nr:cbb3-type cytochrome c oxidase N-terminal domain-containing protein [Catalimonadaceae bacterium]HPI12285.1 cbb3-type cytochrome c oxidase N-terminal domain-containing protein [Catalimonadaceae bacterium]
MKTLISFLTVLLLPLASFAEDAVGKRDLSTEEMMMTAALTLLGFVILFLAVLVVLLIKLKGYLSPMMAKSEEEILYEKQDFWSNVFQLRPMELEKKLVMDHSYDGIQELDNPTPPWFMFLFYSTIVFAIVYGFVYHVIGDGKVMANEYVAQVKEAEIVREAYLKKFANSINENNVTLVTDKAKLAEGKTVYDNNCVACHGAKGEGKVGPNFTDDYWMHGSGIKNIFRTVTEGVPEKGMIAWKKQLNPLQIQNVSSYIMSLKGTNPPNPKEPQGVKEGEEAGPAAPADSSQATTTDSVK